MDRNNIAIATITWARDEAEELLLKKSLQKLAELAIPVFVTDGGSSEAFQIFLKEFPHFTVLKPDERGLWAQAKKSLSEARRSKSRFIYYTEPDKSNFFDQLPDVLEQITVDEQSGIVVAARSEAGFNTFPTFQRMTETTINNCCAELIGKSFDFTYGPFLMNSEIVPHLEKMEENIGWGWRPLAFGIALRLGLSIDAVVQDFSCPIDQQKDTPKERIYRMKQLEENIRGLVKSTQVSLQN
jgi:hypothetical protein